MQNINQKLFSDYQDILESLEDFMAENEFRTRPLKIIIQDKVLQLNETLYHLIEDIDYTKNNLNIICSLNRFEVFLKKERFVSLLYKVLQKEPDLSNFTINDYKKLIAYNDKDILIKLAQCKYINEQVGEKLLIPIYFLLEYLLKNKNLNTTFKKSVIEFIKQQNSKSFEVLLSKYKF